MKLFKIKYLNTKGIAKTRNIKASSESSAMSKIKDMETHYYTIAEDIEDATLKKKVEAIIDKVGGGMPDYKKSWLAKYAMYHAEASSTNYNSEYIGIPSTSSSKLSDMYAGPYDTTEQGR